MANRQTGGTSAQTGGARAHGRVFGMQPEWSKELAKQLQHLMPGLRSRAAQHWLGCLPGSASLAGPLLSP